MMRTIRISRNLRRDLNQVS